MQFCILRHCVGRKTSRFLSFPLCLKVISLLKVTLNNAFPRVCPLCLLLEERKEDISWRGSKGIDGTGDVEGKGRRLMEEGRWPFSSPLLTYCFPFHPNYVLSAYKSLSHYFSHRISLIVISLMFKLTLCTWWILILGDSVNISYYK